MRLRFALFLLLATAAGCSSTSGPSDEGCQNAVTYGFCDPADVQVESCPEGEEECYTDPGCERQYDAICAPRREMDPATFGEQISGENGAYVADYCETDDDCALVPKGDVCGCVECDTSAINVTSEMEYRGALSRARAKYCEQPDGCSDCDTYEASCDTTTSRCVATLVP